MKTDILKAVLDSLEVEYLRSDNPGKHSKIAAINDIREAMESPWGTQTEQQEAIRLQHTGPDDERIGGEKGRKEIETSKRKTAKAAEHYAMVALQFRTLPNADLFSHLCREALQLIRATEDEEETMRLYK